MDHCRSRVAHQRPPEGWRLEMQKLPVPDEFPLDRPMMHASSPSARRKSWGTVALWDWFVYCYNTQLPTSVRYTVPVSSSRLASQVVLWL